MAQPGRPEVLTAEALLARLAAPAAARRILAIAGAPGSGKSTLAETLATRLNALQPGRAALCPMDGFHYDDAVLDARGRRPWKGAPDTFDVGGLRAILSRLRARDEAEVAVPVFDRRLEIARAGAAIIPQAADTIICEGNYLLLPRALGRTRPLLGHHRSDRRSRGRTPPAPDRPMGALRSLAGRNRPQTRRQRPPERTARHHTKRHARHHPAGVTRHLQRVTKKLWNSSR